MKTEKSKNLNAKITSKKLILKEGAEAVIERPPNFAKSRKLHFVSIQRKEIGYCNWR